MMLLNTRPSRRHMTVERTAKPSFDALKKRLLEQRDVSGDFQVLTAPGPAHEQCYVAAMGDDRFTYVGMMALDTAIGRGTRMTNQTLDNFELVFNPRNDDVGFHQFYVAGKEVKLNRGVDNDASYPHRDRENFDRVQVMTHLPYPENHSSKGMPLKLHAYEQYLESFSATLITKLQCHWTLMKFATKDLFLDGVSCGFNAVRDRPYLMEFSSWNFCSGNGSQDARSLGRLYARKPAAVTLDRAELRGRTLELHGSMVAGRATVMLALVDPLGESHALRIKRGKGKAGVTHWSASISLPKHTGRYRLVPIAGGKPIEPSYISIDVPDARRNATFEMGVTYDPPMSIIANYYTPQRLDREMRMWRDLGLSRVQWLEYFNWSDWPSFWSLASREWHASAEKTFKACGNLLAAATKAAHANDLKLFGCLKVFDIGFNCFFTPPDGESTVMELENKHVSVIREIAANQQLTMQTDPAWVRQPNPPVCSLRLYSVESLPHIKPSQVKLLVSKDNKKFTPYRGKMSVKQSTIKRPHQRWTPAGALPDKGTATNHMLELTGLSITQPYVIVQINEPHARFVHRGYMVAEATGDDGNPSPLTMATNGNAEAGLFFWKGWGGWNNHNERILETQKWDGSNVGMVFREAPSMPAALEPTYETTRDLWLGMCHRMLDAGVDGIDVRTYCHHLGYSSFLRYAFAEPVRETFHAMYGRSPRLDAEDYERIRNIRGECFTQFIRDLSEMPRGRGKSLIVQLESGIDVPNHLDVRMHLPLQWRTWIEEGLVDELHLKWFTAESTFVHEEVMPLANRHGIPVHLISRCLHTGLDVRAAEMAERLIGTAADAGFAGYSFYEQANLMSLNPLGYPMLQSPVEPFLAKARQVLGRALGTGAGSRV